MKNIAELRNDVVKGIEAGRVYFVGHNEQEPVPVYIPILADGTAYGQMMAGFDIPKDNIREGIKSVPDKEGVIFVTVYTEKGIFKNNTLINEIKDIAVKEQVPMIVILLDEITPQLKPAIEVVDVAFNVVGNDEQEMKYDMLKNRTKCSNNCKCNK